MAENTTARRATGLKMLKDYQVKKKNVVKHPSSNQAAQQSTEHFVKNLDEPRDESEQLQLTESIAQIQNTTLPDTGEYINNNVQQNTFPYFSNATQKNTNSDTFFDDLSCQSYPNQSNYVNNNNPNSESNVPMIESLFTNTQVNADAYSAGQSGSTVEVNSSPDLDKKIENLAHQSLDNIDEHTYDMKSLVENSRLQQQLQFHMQTVEFLVSEKSELNSKVNAFERQISDMKNVTDDLTGRLNISRHRASHLEMENANLKEKYHLIEESLTKSLQDIARYQSIELTSSTRNKELEEELQEIKTIMDNKSTENKQLQNKIDQMIFQINANELRLQQLTQGQTSETLANGQVSNDHSQKLELQIKHLAEQLRQVEIEKNQSNLQYHQYVQQLKKQIESMHEKQTELSLENDNLSNREMNLLQQMQILEKQIQTIQFNRAKQEEKSKPPDNTELQEYIEKREKEFSKLQEQLQQREASFQSLTLELAQSNNQIEELSNTIHLMESDKPDSAKLNAANESDRLAAQKATAQNTKMKLDLEHLEKAFGQMTNSKLELAELLQAEKNLTKTLTLKLVENEENLKDIHSKLLAKDEEMIRLQATSSDLQKELLKQAQLEDRLTHYEAQGQSSNLLQSELELARNKVLVLTHENEKLKKSLSHIDTNLPQNDSTENNTSGMELNAMIQDTTAHADCVNIPTGEAMAKLQNRFTKLMKEVADLSDEKQRLEHLVLQLQGETETICEYITLYQKQRGILKQRENEKNVQLNLLSKERVHMKEQLEQLNSLIRQLVSEKNTLPDFHQKPHNENSTTEFQREAVQTADKIMGLLSEIKTSHLIEPHENCSAMENFHPCPWCSGKLINV